MGPAEVCSSYGHDALGPPTLRHHTWMKLVGAVAIATTTRCGVGSDQHLSSSGYWFLFYCFSLVIWIVRIERTARCAVFFYKN
jgi:hypothetical protein